MAYITWAFFQLYDPATTLTQDEFTPLAERASDVIDMITLRRIAKRGGLSAFSSQCVEGIQKATAAQVQCLDEEGGIGGTFSSISIGKFSYTQNKNGNREVINGIPIAPLVRAYLDACPGLTYTGIERGCR